VTLERGAGTVFLSRGPLSVEVTLDPILLHVEHCGRAVLVATRLFLRSGSETEHLIHLTEGVVAEEAWGERVPVGAAQVESAGKHEVALSARAGDSAARVRIELAGDSRVVVELRADPAPFRLEAEWDAPAGERVTGLGARHAEPFDQSGRRIRLGADRRYTGPDCPPEMIDVGGVPQGDYVPAPWLISSAGRAFWSETSGQGLDLDLTGDAHSISQLAAAGPLRLHLFCDGTPAAQLRRYLRMTGMPPVLPEWAYGHWKSRDVYEHQRDVEEDWHGYREYDIPLDAIVIDSPWETQYNTWEFNRHQFPDPEGLIAGMKRDDVRTVVWVTPWTNLDSSDGQRPPDSESERTHSEPASNYAEGAAGGHFVQAPDGEAWTGRWWMGTGSMIDFTSPAATRWWQDQAREALEMGVAGIKADDGEGYYVPPDAVFADGRRGVEVAWEYGDLYRKAMQEVLDEVHPGEGVLFGRPGWTGQQATGITWGGDQVSDWWSLKTLVTASLTAAASGFSNWSHDVGGYLGERLAKRCPRELLVRWAAFGALTPLMQAHGRFEQEAWRYDDETLCAYRDLVVLHERLVPYIRAAARTASRTGMPIMRPLCLIEPEHPRSWDVGDSYGFGPSMWVAPVLEKGARERRTYLPKGEWLDYWSLEPCTGGREVTAAAPLDQVPIWIRLGSIVVTYPAETVRRGLEDTRGNERPLEATLWGVPPCGRSKAVLADGACVRWHAGQWKLPATRNVSVMTIGGR
jgi:alpha-glucosidase (family GH31 glycosyl hydrolase)